MALYKTRILPDFPSIYRMAMDTTLNPIEQRILGCLVEKQITTPDYYPLTLNALTNACNQKSNREPVVHFEETDVVRGLDGLRQKGFAQLIESAGSRIPKYQHTLPRAFDLTRYEVAILCELLLRGAQTVGELKNRASRMVEFADLQQVETTLNELAAREHPLVVKMPRRTGHKESRFMHLLGGMPDMTEEETASLAPEAATAAVRAENERIARLETELASLRELVTGLQQQFDEFRRQFE
jgi:uncharacterized protein YceH (UPF0502 family)